MLFSFHYKILQGTLLLLTQEFQLHAIVLTSENEMDNYTLNELFSIYHRLKH